MGKALMTVEGIGKAIDPDFDVYEEARPLFMELLRKRYSPERLGMDLLRKLERLGGAGYQVPQKLEEVLEDLRLGRLRVRTEDPEQARALQGLGRRALTSALVAGLVVGGALLLQSGDRLHGYAFLGAALLTYGAHQTTEALRDFFRRR